MSFYIICSRKFPNSILEVYHLIVLIKKEYSERGRILEMKEIQYLVRSLGIGGNYQGYRYLTYAIYLCLENEDYLLSVSKLLYPEIAQTFQTTAYSVERNLRTVVNVCWERGNRMLLEDISFYPLLSKPTTGEFLDIVSGYLRQNSVY